MWEHYDAFRALRVLKSASQRAIKPPRFFFFLYQAKIYPQ